jgi:hypothetical protein
MSSRASVANPSVHGEYVASDHAGLFGRQEHRRVGDVSWLYPWRRRGLLLRVRFITAAFDKAYAKCPSQISEAYHQSIPRFHPSCGSRSDQTTDECACPAENLQADYIRINEVMMADDLDLHLTIGDITVTIVVLRQVFATTMSARYSAVLQYDSTVGVKI